MGLNNPYGKKEVVNSNLINHLNRDLISFFTIFKYFDLFLSVIKTDQKKP